MPFALRRSLGVMALVIAAVDGCGGGDTAPVDVGVSTVLAEVARDDGTRLVVGLAAKDGREDLVLVADASVVARLPTSYGRRGCRAEIAASLVPGGASIVAACRTGGTNGIGYVAVFGVVDAEPQILIELSCSVTDFVVDVATLTIVSEGERPGAMFAGREQPDQSLTWAGVGGFKPTDAASFDRYCTTGPDSHDGPG